MILSGKQKAFLKKIGSLEKTVVQIGAKGITDSVLQSVEEVLQARELIKISIASPNSAERKQMYEEIAAKTNAVVVQSIGKVCLLYRENSQKPIISPELKKQL